MFRHSSPWQKSNHPGVSLGLDGEMERRSSGTHQRCLTQTDTTPLAGGGSLCTHTHVWPRSTLLALRPAGELFNRSDHVPQPETTTQKVGRVNPPLCRATMEKWRWRCRLSLRRWRTCWVKVCPATVWWCCSAARRYRCPGRLRRAPSSSSPWFLKERRKDGTNLKVFIVTEQKIFSRACLMWGGGLEERRAFPPQKPEPTQITVKTNKQPRPEEVSEPKAAFWVLDIPNTIYN